LQPAPRNSQGEETPLDAECIQPNREKARIQAWVDEKTCGEWQGQHRRVCPDVPKLTCARAAFCGRPDEKPPEAVGRWNAQLLSATPGTDGESGEACTSVSDGLHTD
jgi:hypothetical protein